jgi:hypothetical protein
VIRYLASEIPNAYGPQVHDPRTGEIIESHIGWYHNVMKLVHDWYMIQAGAIDPRARKMQFDEELMGELIRFVSSHEVGHTLGLRHNMGSSSQTPVEWLRNKEWVEKNGHTASIMDYARFNYVAQPEDSISYKGIYPRIGDYDKWAIEFGYKPVFDAKDENEDRLYWNREIVSRLKENPRLWFGSEEIRIDPRSQREDLGDNSMLASDYGLKNLQRVIKALPEWTQEEGDLDVNLKRMYGEAVSQYKRYIGHVCENIGGLYRTYKSVEQEGDVYTAVPKTRQKEALDWLNRHVFQKPEWMVAETYMSRFTENPDEYLYGLVDAALNAQTTAVINAEALARMQGFADRDAANYRPEEYLTDLYGLVFSEVKSGAKVDSYRRYVQRRLVEESLKVVAAKGDASDAKALVRYELQQLATQAEARSKTAADKVTKAHWADLAKRIQDAFSAQQPRG